MLQATDEELKDVGHRATQALRDAGISVEWNGDPDETILIKVSLAIWLE